MDLPGVSLALLESLTSEDQEDYIELWETKIYGRAIERLISDMTDKMLNVFYVDQKLATRETSEFINEVNNASDLAGVKIRFALPKYAKLHILSIGVFSEEGYSSPPLTVKIYDTDQDGELLKTITADVNEGRNTINVDEDFDRDEIFVCFDPEAFSLRKSNNKYFQSRLYPYDSIACEFPCVGSKYTGYVRQVEGGGINVKFVVQCSVRKFIEENLNIFKHALWWAVGVEATIERTMSDDFNRFTTMTIEEAEGRMTFFNAEYDKKITSITSGLHIPEDNECFLCKQPVQAVVTLP